MGTIPVGPIAAWTGVIETGLTGVIARIGCGATGDAPKLIGLNSLASGFNFSLPTLGNSFEFEDGSLSATVPLAVVVVVVVICSAPWLLSVLTADTEAEPVGWAELAAYSGGFDGTMKGGGCNPW
jgi:hypothetical protein